MTTNTNAVLAQLRHLYANMMGGEVRDTAQTKRMAQGLLAPAIEALEQAALTTAAAVPPEGWVMVPVELANRVQESLGEFLMDHGWSQRDMDTSDDFGAVLLSAAPKAEPALVGEQDEPREDASYESMNLAVMVLSDCGHSSNYIPLLERVAGRIDRHVERLLTAQQADRAMRAQAAPETRDALGKRLISEVLEADAIATAACRRVAELPDRSSPEDWPEAMLVTHEELHSIVFEAINAAQAAPQPAVQQGDDLQTFAIGDSNYAAGMLLGWNLCTAGMDAEFSRIREDRMRAAVQASRAAHPAAPVAQGDALIDFIESAGSVHIHRVRAGFNGPIRWDVEYGYEDAKVSGRTLRDALSGVLKAGAASAAKEGGA